MSTASESPPRKLRWRSFAVVLGVAILLLVGGVVMLVMAVQKQARGPSGSGADHAGDSVLLDVEKPHKGEAVTDDEKMVEKEIQQRATFWKPPTTVTMLRWGPHDCSSYTGWFNDPTKGVVIRVVYEMKREDGGSAFIDTLAVIHPRGDCPVIAMSPGDPSRGDSPLENAERVVSLGGHNTQGDDWREIQHAGKLKADAMYKEEEEKAKGK